MTYSLVLDLLSLAALESGTVALVLETLGSHQSLNLGGLGVRRLALTLGLDLSSDNVLADLVFPIHISFCDNSFLGPREPPIQRNSSIARDPRRGTQKGPLAHTLPRLPLPPPQLRVGDDRV